MTMLTAPEQLARFERFAAERMGHPEQAWHRGIVAIRLLADIALNPPRQVRRLAPLRQVFSGGGEYVMAWDRNDERVAALEGLADAAYGQLVERIGHRAAMGVLPDLDGLIDAAVRGEGRAL